MTPAFNLIDLSVIRTATAAGVNPATAWQPALSEAAHLYMIKTPRQICSWLANVGVESAALTATVENMNYSAQGLANTWPDRFAIDPKAPVKVPNQRAVSLAYKPEMIANVVYAYINGNGGPETGDGWRNRGKGGIQLTGATMQHRYADHAGISDIEEITKLPHAALSAGWYWWDNAIGAKAERGDWLAVRRAINGPRALHYELTRDRTNAALKLMGAA